jgi:Fe-S cluster assembly iron-binding protein IscA
MISIDISIYATERIQELLAEAGREDACVRVYCVPG